MVHTVKDFGIINKAEIDVLHFINTRYDKWKDNVKKKFIFIYTYDSCPDNEETAIWLLYGSSAYMLMSELF